MSEDLTKANHGLIKELLQQKKAGRVSAFWTHGGKIMAKQHDESPPSRITTSADIDSLING